MRRTAAIAGIGLAASLGLAATASALNPTIKPTPPRLPFEHVLGRKRKSRKSRMRDKVRAERRGEHARNLGRKMREKLRLAVSRFDVDVQTRKNLRERMSNWQSCQWIKAGRPSAIDEMARFATLPHPKRVNKEFAYSGTVTGRISL